MPTIPTGPDTLLEVFKKFVINKKIEYKMSCKALTTLKKEFLMALETFSTLTTLFKGGEKYANHFIFIMKY